MANPQYEVTPDNVPSVEREPLSSLELQAKAHWRRFLPNTTQALERQGTLDQTIRNAYHRAEYESLIEMNRNPDLSQQEVQSTFRSRYLFPPPEPHTTPA